MKTIKELEAIQIDASTPIEKYGLECMKAYAKDVIELIDEIDNIYIPAKESDCPSSIIKAFKEKLKSKIKGK